MTKKKDQQTISIFEFITEQRAQFSSGLGPGSCNIDAKLRAAVAADVKHARDEQGRELSQPEVAGRMSMLTGNEITSAVLYSWTADSKTTRTIPARYIPALTMATGQHNAQDVLARGGGGFYMPSPEALRAEIHRIEEEVKFKLKEKRKREMLLQEVDK